MFSVASCATGGGGLGVDAGRDAGAVGDAGRTDAAMQDAGDRVDMTAAPEGGLSDGGSDDASLVADSATPTDSGSGSDGGSDAGVPATDAGTISLSCRTDADCTFGAEWCVHGACVACETADVAACPARCARGSTRMVRNGCTPCTCVVANACTTNSDCALGTTCYAGALCWDWCPPGDPTCCYGNICEGLGCTTPPPTGCKKRGCPENAICLTGGCTSSLCDCVGSGWSCVDDCAGGICAEELEPLAE